MATKRKVKIKLVSGQEALQQFMKKNGRLFNLTELERFCELSNGKLRHISASGRPVTPDVYESVRKALSPKLYELLFLLNGYSSQEQEMYLDFD